MTQGLVTENPLVSVVIPTFNRRNVLLHAIDSVFNQTYPNWELIIVDDGSTDGTSAHIEKLISDRKNISIVRHTINKGISAARNTGIEKAQGELVAFLDSDDEWLPEKLEKQIYAFIHAPDKVGIVYTSALFVNKQNNESRVKVAHIEGDILLKELAFNPIGSPSRVMVRRAALVQVGLFDTNFITLEDWDLWGRMCKVYEVRAIDEPLVIYTESEDSISINTDKLINGYEMFWEKHEILKQATWIQSLHYLRLGHRLCYVGALQKGRRYLWKSVIMRPLDLKNISLLILSFSGWVAYRRVTFLIMKYSD